MRGKVALVMGGGAGTGRATALAFAREGARVVVADINETLAQKTAGLIQAAGGEALAVRADMASAADIQAVMEAVRSTWGGLHLVSNNAAAAPPNKALTDITEEEWDRCMSVTLRGVWLCLKHELPLIEASGGGAIVNVASLSGLRGDPHQGAYAAAKGGVLALSKTAATEDARLHTGRQSLRRTGIEQASLAQQQNVVAALCFVEIRGRPDDSRFGVDKATHHRPQFTPGRGINPN